MRDTPVVDTALLAALRADLGAADFTLDAVAASLGPVAVAARFAASRRFRPTLAAAVGEAPGIPKSARWGRAGRGRRPPPGRPQVVTHDRHMTVTDSTTARLAVEIQPQHTDYTAIRRLSGAPDLRTGE